ncbi:MAG: prepilin-type N-terminal cleavage/methylation domain-containing protein [Candidatus Yonathbacteria bacterium]|nr:prepilin-type N-terminal cleavage/methylation domain-containing protein [Candidatus Yonathbacteria bacterium]
MEYRIKKEDNIDSREQNSSQRGLLRHSIFNIQYPTRRGFTLVEMVIYVAAFSLLSIVALQATMVVMKSFYSLRLNQSVGTSATVVLERMSREIRSAYDIDTTTSTFGSTPGRLTLKTKNSLGANTTVEFYVDAASQLNLKEGGVSMGPLVTKTVTATNLVFRSIATTNSKAIKIELTLHDSRATSTQSTKFYDTIVLRGSVH